MYVRICVHGVMCGSVCFLCIRVCVCMPVIAVSEYLSMCVGERKRVRILVGSYAHIYVHAQEWVVYRQRPIFLHQYLIQRAEVYICT